jgi:hypothetical protein
MNTRTRSCPTGNVISLVVSVSVISPGRKKKDVSGKPDPAQSYFGM